MILSVVIYCVYSTLAISIQLSRYLPLYTYFLLTLIFQRILLLLRRILMYIERTTPIDPRSSGNAVFYNQIFLCQICDIRGCRLVRLYTAVCVHKAYDIVHIQKISTVRREMAPVDTKTYHKACDMVYQIDETGHKTRYLSAGL